MEIGGLTSLTEYNCVFNLTKKDEIDFFSKRRNRFDWWEVFFRWKRNI